MLSVHEVSSRKDLTEREWTLIAARLSAAEKHPQLFDGLVEKIKCSVGLCRAVRVGCDGTCKQVYEGVITDDIEVRCQSHADKNGCLVRLECADGIKCFEPAVAAAGNCPSRVFEIHRSANETTYVEIPFPDCSDITAWGQRHANETGFDVHITCRCRLGHNRLICFEPQVSVEISVNEVSIDGVVWILLNQWENNYHWVKFDRTMERYIASGSDRSEAIDKLVEYVKESR